MRTLPFELLNAQTAVKRRRAFRLDVYDVVSTKALPIVDNISRVVQFNLLGGFSLNAITGPRDFTNEVESIEFSERGSDFAQGTLAGNSLQITIADKGNRWDPVEGTEGRWLRQGNVVVLREGDLDSPLANWPTTFTGTIVGRAAMSGKDRAGNSQLTVFAEDRLLSHLKHSITTEDIPQGTTLRDIIRTILEDELFFGAEEHDLGTVASQLTSQASTQIVDENPMVAIAKLAFPDGFVPRFRGNGVLELVPNFIDISPAVAYEDDNLFEPFQRPFSPLETPNRVEVIGLDKNQTKVTQPSQVLSTAAVTLGFFTGDASIRIKFSDDETQQAQGTRLIKNSSVNGALIPFGGEDWEPNTDDDGGVRGGRIKVEGSFFPALVVSGFAGRIAASAIPDAFAGLGGGNTIPIGRLIEGIITVVNQTIMSTIGRGDYEIVGEPFEWVFKELKGVAQIDNVDVNDFRTVVIENHLLDTQAKVDAVALRELRTIRKRGNTFSFNMRHDLRLQPMDKFVRADNREFIIDSITRTVGRDATESCSVTCYETTTSAIP